MAESSEKEALFVKVAECLYRNRSSGSYFALVKRRGKQIRKSLRTKDRKLADLDDRASESGNLIKLLGSDLLTFQVSHCEPPAHHSSALVQIPALNSNCRDDSD